jgi:hypothetical protein
VMDRALIDQEYSKLANAYYRWKLTETDGG